MSISLRHRSGARSGGRPGDRDQPRTAQRALDGSWLGCPAYQPAGWQARHPGWPLFMIWHQAVPSPWSATAARWLHGDHLLCWQPSASGHMPIRVP